MPSGILTAPTLHSATVDVAGIVYRVACRSLKPVLWARELHPEFLSTGSPDVDVVVEYDDGYWERGLPWIAPDTVEDRPVVTRDGAALAVTTVYYRARVAPGGRRIDVTMASGFRVGGLMRTLSALLLPSRGGVLVRATRLASSPTAVLVVGLPDGARGELLGDAGSAVFDGFVAVTGSDGHYTTFATPFPDDAPAAGVGGVPLGALLCVRAGAGTVPRPLGAAAAVARLSSHLCVVDREPAALERVLDIATEIARAVPAYDASALPGVDPGAYGIRLA